MEDHAHRRRWIPVTVLALGLLSTTAITWIVRRGHLKSEGERFARSAMQTQAEMAERMATCEAMLRATAGLFAGSEHVTASEFRVFVNTLELSTAYPGIQAIGLSERFTNPVELLERIRREYGDGIAIHPPGDRDEYDAIVYLEPLDDQSRHAIGYDMFSEPVRRKAMERARDQGAPVASGPLIIIDGSGQVASTFNVYYPMYDGGELPATIEGRRQRLTSYVYSSMLASDLFDSLFAGSPPPAEFAVYDVGSQGGRVQLYQSPGFASAVAAGKPVLIADLNIAGRTWTIESVPGPAFARVSLPDPTPLAGSAGAIVSFLLFWLARVQTRAAERIELNTEQLRESEARKGAILESALDAIITMDQHGRIIEWNPAAERVFGWSRNDAIGKELATLIIPRSLRDRHREGLQRLLHLPFGAALGRRLESTALRADGAEFPVEVSVCRIGDNEPATFTGFVRDITERTMAERHQLLMSRELDHRVKNNLSSVIAILRESARRSKSSDDLVQSATGRIRALAGLHEMLAVRKWQGADIGELVRRTLAPYQLEGRRRVTMIGEPLTIPGRAASALCMALHELATNAAKYGSLSTSEGRVEIAWHEEIRPPGERWVVLAWQERDGPPVQPPAQRGFGSELIEGGIAFETGGDSVMTFAPEGLACIISLPCPQTSAPDEGAAA